MDEMKKPASPAENGKPGPGFGGPGFSGGSMIAPGIPEAPAAARDDSNKLTRQYLDSVMLEYRYIGSRTPDMNTEFLGHTFSSPIMIGGLSAMVVGMHPNGLVEFGKAAAELNLLCFVGYLQNKQVEDVCATGAKTARVIKLQADTQKVLDDIKHDADCGAFAYAMDIDHVFGRDGRNYISHTPDYGDLAPRDTDQLREIIASSELPCILKGVLSISDAKKAVEAGAKGILISHHKGEVPCAVPPAYVLPEIKAAVGGRISVLADCGIISGLDAYKVLARGAESVCVARALLADYRKEGAEGIVRRLNQINDELRCAMARTGTVDTRSFDITTLRKIDW